MNWKRLPSVAAVSLCALALVNSPAWAQHGEHGQHEDEDAEFAQPTTYADAIHVIHEQLEKIDSLIETRKLDRVHAEAAVIRDVAKTLARLALKSDSGVPREAIREINLTARGLAAKFGPIDEAGDSGDLAGTQKVYDEMVALFATLEKYTPLHEQAYVCPMGCEGYKTYHEPGQCPRCGMKITPVSADWPTFTVDIAPRPASIRPNEEVAVEITLKDGDGRVVTKLETIHERPLHLIMVSKDLSWFAHEHPNVQSNGSFSLRFTFPNPGEYVLFHDFTPLGVGEQIVPATLRVQGTPPAPVALRVDARMTKQVDGYTVTLDTGGSITVGDEAALTFNVTRNGQPVTNFEPYLGAIGHLVFISEDLEQFVHSHPLGKEHGGGSRHEDERHGAGGDDEHAEHGGLVVGSSSSVLTFHARFPEAGLYKGWAEFQHQGRIVTVPFVVEVQPSAHEDEHEDPDRHEH
ncbi:MAG: heavy metal-binding domain-containing protein [Phycisphaerales bacterium]